MHILLVCVITKNMQISEELGIGYIASILRENGYKVTIYIEKDDKFDFNYIQSLSPHIIGFCVYYPNITKTNIISKVIYTNDLCKNICYGGYEATYNYETILSNNEQVKFIIPYEGEFVFLNLVECLERNDDIGKVNGLIYRKEKEIIQNERVESIRDLDELPYPSRDILRSKRLHYAQISSSRGCMGNCSFCNPNYLNKKWLGRSPAKIVDEIEYIVNEFNIHQFSFNDASFEDINRYKDQNGLQGMYLIAKEIIRRNLKIFYHVGFRAEFYKHIDQETMDLLIKSGLMAVFIGVDSGNEFDLKLYNKITTVEDNYNVMNFIKNYPVNVKIGFINFNPYSTFENLNMNLKFLKQFNMFKTINYRNKVTLYKGMAIYDLIQRDNLKNLHNDEYKFIDPRIEKLQAFIEYANSVYLSQCGIPIQNFLNKYLIDYECELIVQKRSAQNNEVIEFIEDREKEYTKIMDEINESNYLFYTNILKLAEENWAEEKAMDYLIKYLNKDYVKELLTKLEMIKQKTLLYLFKMSKRALGADDV